MTLLLISLGALVGAPTRYLTDRGIQTRLGHRFPWGTFTVNMSASLLLGGLLGAGSALDSRWLALVGTGLCGTLSTYSTFSYETLRLHQGGDRLLAIANVALSLVGGLALASAGWAIGSALG